MGIGLCKVDKKQSFGEGNMIFCELVEDDGESEFSLEEKECLHKAANAICCTKKKRTSR
jgi:hypothetical protein